MLTRGADRHAGDRQVGPVGQPPVEGGGLVDAEYRSGRDRDVGDRVLSPGPAPSKMWVLLQSVRVFGCTDAAAPVACKMSTAGQGT